MNIRTNPTYNIFANARRRNIVNKLEFDLHYEDEIMSYCTNMANAITAELQQSGHCWLIDSAFSTGYIFSVDWAIIQALRNQQGNSGRLKLTITTMPQMLPISDNMEKEMLSLYQKQPLVGRSNNEYEHKNALLVAETNELKRQFEQAKQTKSDLDSRISQLKNEVEQLQRDKSETQASIQNQINSARNEAESILREAKEKAASIRASLMQGMAVECAQESVPTQSDGASLRDQVENETQRLETTIRTSLNSYRDEIHKMIYEFRTGLYKVDYTSLCSAYQKLYMFATISFDKRIVDLIEKLGSEELAVQTQGELCKIQGQLFRRVTAMEESIKKLGLIVYRPEQGEEYNDVYHAAENTEDDGYLEATIRSCVCPGIRTNEQVLCRAAVMVDVIQSSETCS